MRPVVKVDVNTRGFGDFDRKLGRAVYDALNDAGDTMEQVAQQNPSRYDIGAITGASRKGTPFTTRRGAAIEVTNDDERAGLFELGTYRKGKRGGWGNPGVRPVRFLRRGLRAGRLKLIPALQRRMPR